MKHHKRLQDLTEVLQEVNLQNIPTLIVDDEADQAGLNNLVNEDDESTTYQKLRLFRNAVPHHTFLQYTATPQAPLLINIIDILSPDFAIVLNPGTSYVGGQDFFNQNAYHVPEIPPEDIPTRSHPLHEPPPSLLKAMRIFFLGVASGLIRHRGMGNRSMMVHPSRLTVGHEVYYNWVLTKRNAWLEALSDPSSYAYTTLRVDFQEAYEDLQQTVSDLESFERLMAQLQRTIRRTELYKVNASSGRTPEIDWRGTYAHILVGGQALDRGFTVKGLTITYMPRGVGARRADTIQQRARFLGYHRAYPEVRGVLLSGERLI